MVIRWQGPSGFENSNSAQAIFHLRFVERFSLTRSFSKSYFNLTMSSNVPISQSDLTAPTPQNTPLNQAPIAAGLSRPTVPDITEDNEDQDEDDEGPSGPLGSADIQAAMLGMVQGRLAGLVGKSSGYIEALPVGVKRNVEALKGVQVKQTELQNQYKRECLELEKKVSICFLQLWGNRRPSGLDDNTVGTCYPTLPALLIVFIEKIPSHSDNVTIPQKLPCSTPEIIPNSQSFTILSN